MFEIEQKFPIIDVTSLEEKLQQCGATEQASQTHSDTYYNHPCRDFAETKEALRVRRCNGVPMVTYKGAKLAGTIKARREMEWRLDPGDSDGTKTEELFIALGFHQVATVAKTRRTFTVNAASKNDPLVTEPTELTVTIDHVTELGWFAEIELVLMSASPTPQEIDRCRQTISDLASSLGLSIDEPRSYLTMLLEKQAER